MLASCGKTVKNQGLTFYGDFLRINTVFFSLLPQLQVSLEIAGSELSTYICYCFHSAGKIRIFIIWVAYYLGVSVSQS